MRPFLILFLAACTSPLWAEASVLDQAQAAIGLPADQRAERLDALLQQVGANQRPEIYGLIGSRRVDGVERILDDGLADPSPGVRAAAIGAVARLWPTSLQQLQLVRREVDGDDPRVRQAAIAALGEMRVDASIDLLIGRVAE